MLPRKKEKRSGQSKPGITEARGCKSKRPCVHSPDDAATIGLQHWLLRNPPCWPLPWNTMPVQTCIISPMLVLLFGTAPLTKWLDLRPCLSNNTCFKVLFAFDIVSSGCRAYRLTKGRSSALVRCSNVALALKKELMHRYPPPLAQSTHAWQCG